MALPAISAAAQVPTVYFDQEKIHTLNRARAGRSRRTFLTAGLWDKVRSELKPGDYVLLPMGHNDAGPPDKDRAGGSLPAQPIVLGLTVRIIWKNVKVEQRRTRLGAFTTPAGFARWSSGQPKAAQAEPAPSALRTS